ncbi:uncharacterized protein F4807DRAFT_68569 [Annulohypoxylon truncatum]|uniref:uncharacterized protein n=1 Tax=Annulohypoxylon truncatum TaxID=327061 RepID=UPI0020072199|nr:uncharacterized protein F4807DRAFT_68569 [Annulohypoxylon truncatum]KAI1210502.1 hypothetical protein F4807DRAFT_68569 [Annulohypoxylon truncatum]
MRPSFAVFTAVMASVQVHAAMPPACLLSALGVQQNPTDMKAVCGDLQDAIQGNLTSACHTDVLPQAYKVYSSKCLAEGVTVAALPTSTSSGASSSGSASATGSGVASVSATATGSSSGSSEASNSASATSSSSSAAATGNAGMATEPQPFLYAAAALFATGLTSVLFL